MKQQRFVTFIYFAVLSLILAIPAQADDFDHVFLAAGCTSYRTNGVLGKSESMIVRTDFGVAVQHPKGSTFDVILFCNVDPDPNNYFNFLQIAVEDNTPTGFVQATLYGKALDDDTPAVELASVKSSDAPGLQRHAWFGDLHLNEMFNHYYIEILISKESPDDRVLVYWAGLRDVF